MIRYLTWLFAALLAPYVVALALVVITQPPMQHAVNILFVASPLASIVLLTVVFNFDNRDG